MMLIRSHWHLVLSAEFFGINTLTSLRWLSDFPPRGNCRSFAAFCVKNGSPCKKRQPQQIARKLAYYKHTADFNFTLLPHCSYPLSIRFGRPRLTTNERIVLASTFHSFYAIASQLSPEPKSSGIEVLEAGAFRLHCYQTVTGIKFIVLADARQASLEPLLRRLFELYADYALKNPFYSLEMPIRCELFDTNLQAAVEQMERTGISNV